MKSLILKDLFKFSLVLFLAAGVSYALHFGFITYFESDGTLELINFSYKFNVGITLLFTCTILLASERLKNQLGFISLISGMMKLGIFLYLIKASGYTLEKSVFLHFFIPYAVCVIVETFYVIRTLNRINYSEDE